MSNQTAPECLLPPAEYQLYLFPAVYIFALVIGLPGNLAAIYVFTFRVKPRTAFSIYISSLALADVAILCTLPFRIHYHLNRNNWVFGDMACQITGILYYANIHTSICFMTCICLDRYMATVHPHAYLKLRGPRYALLTSSVLWALAGIAVAVFILMGPLKTKGDDSGGHSCFENFAAHEWSSRLFPYSLLIIFCSLLPSATILVCYSLAARRISRIHTKMGRRALRVIYVTIAITLICFLPNHAVYLLHLLRRMKVIQSCPLANAIYNARRVTMALVILNTCLDPLLYYVTTSHCTWKPLKRSWFGVRRRRVIYTITV